MKTSGELIQDYLHKGKKGKEFTDQTAIRKAGVIKNFLTFASEEGFQLNNIAEISEAVASTKPAGMSRSDAEKVRIMDVDPADFMRSGVPKFVETKDEFKRLQAHMDAGKPLLFVGPKGIGKTLCVDAFSETKSVPLVRYDCSENTKSFDLVGRYMMIGSETVFQLGVLPTAIEVANKSETKCCVLVLEEMNALTNAMQKVLNQLLDYRNNIFVGGINKHYGLNEGVKLLICATMNPSTYGGTHEVNEDLKSRFPTWKWDYPSDSEEKKIVNKIDIPDELVDRMMLLSKETRAAVKKQEITYALSTRDLDLFFDLYRAYDKVKGLDSFELAFEEAILGKFDEEEEVTWINSRKKSIFPKKVSQSELEAQAQRERELEVKASVSEDADYDDDDEDDYS